MKIKFFINAFQSKNDPFANIQMSVTLLLTELTEPWTSILHVIIQIFKQHMFKQKQSRTTHLCNTKHTWPDVHSRRSNSASMQHLFKQKQSQTNIVCKHQLNICIIKIRMKIEYFIIATRLFFHSRAGILCNTFLS